MTNRAAVAEADRVPAAAEIAAGILSEIEDLIADGSLFDALGRLQDLVRDFAPDLAADVLRLRGRYEDWRRRSRDRSARPEDLNDLRDVALELSFAAEQHARLLDTLHVEPTPSMTTRLDSAKPPLPVAPSSATDHGKNPFKAVWRDVNSVVAEARGVQKAFKSNAFSLEPLSFQLRIGEITGIVGRNASGKTTLLRMLMGDLKPDAGSLAYPRLSAKLDWARIKRQIAHVPQLPERWYGALRHNLNVVAATHAHEGQDVEQLIDWCVARYEMSRYEYATWDEISGGYKIRFELVRALVSQPRLLILDEPLAYLDVIARQRFLRDLQTIATSVSNPIPIVITSQHINEIEAVADQMILLDDGACRYVGTLAGIAELAQHRIVEVSLAAIREEAALALEGLGLQRIEPTMEGFLFAFPKSVDIGHVFQRLRAAFGDRFSAFRDITGSARSLLTENAQ